MRQDEHQAVFFVVINFDVNGTQITQIEWIVTDFLIIKLDLKLFYTC